MLGINMTWFSLDIKSVYWWRDRVLLPTGGCTLFGHLSSLWPTIPEEDLHPIRSDKAYTWKLLECLKSIPVQALHVEQSLASWYGRSMRAM